MEILSEVGTGDVGEFARANWRTFQAIMLRAEGSRAGRGKTGLGS